jgi:uncharacterized protein YigE (DUF2233 family)
MRRAALAIVLSLGCVTVGNAAPCASRIFEDDSFTVCTFNSRTEELRLAWKGHDGFALNGFANLAADLGADANRVRFAMNAGMFEVNGIPLGLYIANGKTLRPLNRRTGGGNFYLKPNGVFSLNANAAMRIEPTDAFALRSDTPRWATQSGPMLVIDGQLNPQIAADGPSKNLRNGVGLRDAHTALFVISEEPVSFGKLARFFRDGLGCADALYFDGAVSSLWRPATGRMDHDAPLGPMVVVLARP